MGTLVHPAMVAAQMCRTAEIVRPIHRQLDLWVIAVVEDDATVVRMFGAFDIDSLHFETRCLIRRIQKLTGENLRDAVHHALAERCLRLTDPASAQYIDPVVTVILAPDVARDFPNAGAVNEALRQLRQRRGTL